MGSSYPMAVMLGYLLFASMRSRASPHPKSYIVSSPLNFASSTIFRTTGRGVGTYGTHTHRLPSSVRSTRKVRMAMTMRMRSAQNMTPILEDFYSEWVCLCPVCFDHITFCEGAEVINGIANGFCRCNDACIIWSLDFQKRRRQISFFSIVREHCFQF